MHSFRKLAAGALAVVGVALVAGTRGAVAEAEAPFGKPVDGIRCEAAEGAVSHIHQHLVVLDHGKPVAVPSDVGRPLFASCLYWLHTHGSDGIIHVESPVLRTFTLGNFFDVWGQPLSSTRVGALRVAPGALRIYVNGTRYRGNPRKIELSEHADITLEAGPPYGSPAPFSAWNGQ